MEKVTTLDKKMLNTITANDNLSKELRDLLEIPNTKNFGIGDTMVMLNTSSNEGDVFKFVNQKGETRYYIVIEPVDENMAYCYSIFEK